MNPFQRTHFFLNGSQERGVVDTSWVSITLRNVANINSPINTRNGNAGFRNLENLSNRAQSFDIYRKRAGNVRDTGLDVRSHVTSYL